jgi:hypothetical protein
LVWALALCLAIAAVFFFFNPERYAFYPKCPLYEYTHLKCPGCGTLRATYQLVHGHFAAAFRYNPLVVSLMPVAGWIGLVWAVRRLTGKPWPYIFLRPAWGWFFLGASLLFGIVRNFLDL